MTKLYRERTFDEWKALPTEQQVALARGRQLTDYGYMADEQATRNAAMGEAVYAALADWDAPTIRELAEQLRVQHQQHRDGLACRLLRAVADAEEATGG